MHDSAILAKLSGGDRRSIGRSAEVVADVLRHPAKFDALFSAMSSSDPLVRMRAADAVEKITALRPAYLQPYKRQLVDRIAAMEQQEMRWHVAQMLPRLRWTEAERHRLVHILTDYLDDRSRIVRTFAMQSLADLARQGPELMPMVVPLLGKLAASGTPAMRARGRKLLAELDDSAANTQGA
jgi:HEAT repeat protein